MEGKLSGILHDRIIQLREITIDDADFLIRLVSDPMVIRYLPGMIQGCEILISWIQGLTSKDHEYMVSIEETDELIGECSLTVAHDNTAEIGLMLLPQFWCQGYGTEVVRQLLEKAQQMKVTEIKAMTDIENKPAVQLLTKMGFQKQHIGWMTSLSEDGEKLSKPLIIVSFNRKM